MKNNIILVSLLAILLNSCGLDNYEEPKSQLTGKVVYNGQPIGVKGSGGDDGSGGTTLQLWQNGYQLKNDYIRVNVAQDGTFTAMLFDGDYELVAKDNNGPWENRHDTIRFSVKGNTVQDYPVIPYYTISNETFSLNGKTLTATFDVTRISQSKNIEAVYLYVNKTQFVDNSSQVQALEKVEGIAPGKISLSMNLSDDTFNQKFLFARVAVKISGVPDYVYSTTIKQIK